MNRDGPAMNGREKQFVRALQRLGSGHFSNFLQAVRTDGCTAVQTINEELGRGSSLESVFVTGEEFGYSLSVKRLSKGAFLISFGFQADPLAGDGGDWEVRFDEEGSVVSIVPGVFWIS